MSNYEVGEMTEDQIIKSILKRPELYGLCRIPERAELEHVFSSHQECIDWQNERFEGACWECDWDEPERDFSLHQADLVIKLLRGKE